MSKKNAKSIRNSKYGMRNDAGKDIFSPQNLAPRGIPDENKPPDTSGSFLISSW